MENRQEQIRAIMEEQRSFYETGKHGAWNSEKTA